MQSQPSETVPAWAMKLIADAQVPNGRWIHFKEGEPVKTIIDWYCETAIRITFAKTFMQMFGNKLLR